MGMQLKIFSSPQSTSARIIIKFTPFRSINASTAVGWLLQYQCIASLFVLFVILPSSTQISLKWFALTLHHQHVRHLNWAELCSVMYDNSKLSPLCLEIFTYLLADCFKVLVGPLLLRSWKDACLYSGELTDSKASTQGSMSLMFNYWTNLIYTYKQSIQ